MITKEEAKRMIDAATSVRDKALVAVLFEGGFRVGEALGMMLSDVLFEENGAKICVHGNTRSRMVRMITSAPILGLYIQQQPFKDSDGPLVLLLLSILLLLVGGGFLPAALGIVSAALATRMRRIEPAASP